ncbi:ATP synthase subunit e, mitochondrial-like [Lineus longissimus]|uniref:ATP synthase subunit e, mitochondrial-like n=1 Tax=Lineus longissimus TaxID=88925 RepID=UPI002B4D6767
MSALAAPKAVSPLIRFCRYAALFSGLGYGSYRLKSLSAKEEKIQERENKVKAAKAVQLAMEKEAAMKVEMDALAKELGIVTK